MEVVRCCSAWSGYRFVVGIGFRDALKLIIAISVGRKMRESEAWRP